MVLAPIELGPYNRHAGYHYGVEQGAFILGNRHIVVLKEGTLVLAERAKDFVGGFEDFIVHENSRTPARRSCCASTAGR